VVGLEPLVSLIARLLTCRTPASAAVRGFTTRIELGPGPSVLAPASDAVSDLQLSLLLFVIAAVAGDDEAYDKAGLDGLMRQVCSGQRVCAARLGCVGMACPGGRRLTTVTFGTAGVVALFGSADLVPPPPPPPPGPRCWLLQRTSASATT
jgi:hypothetical protein